MSKFRFWATIILAFILGVLGFWLAGIFPMPVPFSLNQSRALYSILGILVGLMSFASLATWTVTTTSRLTRKVVNRLAVEIMGQFTQLTAKGWSLLPGTGRNEGLTQAEGIKMSGAVVVDTSSVIDGRFLDVVRFGFLSGTILIPDFVLRELQQVADSADELKRARGRRGFEIINQLKKIKGIKVEVWDKDLTGKAVDDLIIRLAKMLKGKILTCDYNLAQVAAISGVPVLNINDLANALKSLAIPGDKMNVKISQLGRDRSQGVGYLADGTMVVVKDGAKCLNKSISVEATKVLQGPAGRMIFAKIIK